MASRPDRRCRTALLLVAATVAALGLAGCGSDGSEGSATTQTTAAKTELEGLTRAEPLEVGDASLPEVAPDGTATPFAFKATEGDLLFVAFGYTNCPDVCPTTLYDIKKAKRKLGADGDKVEVAFATVDPERDTAEVMNQYLGSFTTDGHPLRTEDPAELKAAQDAFGVTSTVEKEPGGEVKVAHSAKSFIVDDTGKVLVEWAFGTGADAMASDIEILLDRQAQGT